MSRNRNETPQGRKFNGAQTSRLWLWYAKALANTLIGEIAEDRQKPMLTHWDWNSWKNLERTWKKRRQQYSEGKNRLIEERETIMPRAMS